MDCLPAKARWFIVVTAGWLWLAQSSPIIAVDSPAASPVMANVAIRPTALSRALRNDATINDMTFINPTTGWAVGDRGVIWQTGDGGATWRRQDSPVACTLNAVCFLDAHHGWAVGGYEQPFAGTTRGVVLHTSDSGATWQQLPQPLLPRLFGVNFFDLQHGMAIGQSASYMPAGAFTTRDGGKTWQPCAADEPGNWLAGDFLDPETGVLVGPAGRIATLVRRKIVVSPLAASALRSFRAARLVAPSGGWAVGDGGLILTTNDVGRSWQTSPAHPCVTVADQFDFRAVAVSGTHVWIAGAPGSRIFHSADGGNSWQFATTGQTAPIHALRFVDDQHGWAAGAFGNILTTRDGGRTWQTQHSGAQRAALLAVAANPTDVPLELLAESAAASGYTAAVDVLCNSSDASNTVASNSALRNHEAFLLAGATAADTAWRFPIPPADLALTPEDLIAALNRENDGRALVQIERYLVCKLRTWRPDVVVLPHAALESAAPTSADASRSPTNCDEHLATLVEQLVMKSISAAADPNAFPDLQSEVGLDPWQVKKVYGVAPPGTRGDDAIETAHFSPWLASTLADYVEPARSLLFRNRTSPPDLVELKLLENHLPQGANGRGIFSGISLAPGSDARRLPPDVVAQDFDALQQVATRRKAVAQLLQRQPGNVAWSAQINQLTEGLGNDAAGRLLLQLADGYRQAGRLDLAADTYYLFARKTPDHPLVDPALTWLVQFYASGEIAHRLTTGAAKNAQRSAVAATKQDFTNGQPSATGIEQASATAPVEKRALPAANLSADDRRRRAAQLADYLRASRPALFAEPAVRFAEITAQRNLGFENPASRFFLTLHQLPDSNPWRECAATEEWLAKPGDAPPPKKLAACRQVTTRPRLDGKLNEAFWNTADRLPLRDSSTEKVAAARAGKPAEQGPNNAEVLLAHDEQFLYLAVHCLKAANVEYRPDDGPRPRDADLSEHDRVAIRLDIDRDYSTAYELTVDDRGWTHDACWGDATWNPTWYVAAASDDTSWTVEAAIPLAELVDRPPVARDVWALAIRRTIPRTGYQSWAAPSASDDSPAQFGLLIFQ